MINKTIRQQIYLDIILKYKKDLINNYIVADKKYILLIIKLAETKKGLIIIYKELA